MNVAGVLHMLSRMGNDRGFSLIETLVAIGLVTGAVAALAQIAAASAHTNAAARYRTLASLIAQTQIEDLRAEASLADGDTVQQVDASGRVACSTPDPCADAMFTVRSSVDTLLSLPSMVFVGVEVSHAHGHYGAVRLFAIRARTVR